MASPPSFGPHVYSKIDRGVACIYQGVQILKRMSCQSHMSQSTYIVDRIFGQVVVVFGIVHAASAAKQMPKTHTTGELREEYKKTKDLLGGGILLGVAGRDGSWSHRSFMISLAPITNLLGDGRDLDVKSGVRDHLAIIPPQCHKRRGEAQDHVDEPVDMPDTLGIRRRGQEV